MGFQIIGVDVMLDHQLRPLLLETNNGPSFNLDQDIDRDIKLKVVDQALTMVKTLYRQALPKEKPAAQTPMLEAEILALRKRCVCVCMCMCVCVCMRVCVCMGIWCMCLYEDVVYVHVYREME